MCSHHHLKQTSPPPTMHAVSTKIKFLMTLLPISAFLFFLFITTKPLKHQPHELHLHTHLSLPYHPACEGTSYPELCLSTLASIPNLSSAPLPRIISASVDHTINIVKHSASNCTHLKTRLRTLDQLQTRALNDCVELLDYTLDDLHTALSDLSDKSSTVNHFHDLQTLFTASMTNLYTCLDGFYQKDKHVRNLLANNLHKISHMLSNSLVMLKKIPEVNHSKTTSEFDEMVAGGFPGWISGKDRRLLRAPIHKMEVHIVVAKDGSGDFTTVSEAVEAAPNSTKKRHIIYIKSGAYFENVEVGKKKKKLMFVGDGMGRTIIKASRNYVDGWNTFQSATVAVVGDGFIARDITIENGAGPSKHQAVALRVGADQSAFYRCSFVGYQDTLYVHSNRQFYKECDVYGTIDFIFGNANVVLQDCNLYARRPNPNQKNIFTAQGRVDEEQNSGISIINCKVAAAADLIPVQADFKTYLGRPWKEFSRTVYINSQLDDLIDPAGWLEWNGTFALSTLYYGEYKNRGPGSKTTHRVKWPGYRVIHSSTEAEKFTVANFIDGDDWLPPTDIPYYSGLSKDES